MNIKEISHWCAGSKISGLYNTSKPSIEQLLNVWKKAGHTTSVLIVSCGAKETELRDHLISIGFKKMRNFKNYGHSSGATWLMGYQIPKKFWKKCTGYDGKGNWSGRSGF